MFEKDITAAVQSLKNASNIAVEAATFNCQLTNVYD